jgi:transcriptional regulator with XRE-family HTH domain
MHATNEVTESGWSDESFAETLSKLIEGRGLELSSLAQRMGVNARYLEKLIERDSEPTPEAIELAAEVLDLSPDHFFEHRLAEVVAALEWDPDRVNALFSSHLSALERAHIDTGVFDDRPLRDTVRAVLADEELTQGDLAESLGMTASELSLILNRRVDAPPDFAQSVATALGLAPERLFAFRLDVVAERLRGSHEEVNALWSEIRRGPIVEPYVSWPVRPLPDPRDVSLTDLARSIIEIVEVEEPVLGARVYRLRLRAARIEHETRELRSLLNRASYAAISGGALVGTNEGTFEQTQKYLVLRRPNTPDVRPRERGEREIVEIPLVELSHVAWSTRARRLGGTVKDVQNELLALYRVAQPRLHELEHINRAIQHGGQ